MIRGMSTHRWLDFLGIRLDSRKAEGLQFVMNLVTPDNGETFTVEMSNATLTNIKGVQAKSPDLTITVNRVDLDLVMMGTTTLDDLLSAGKAKLDGDRQPYEKLKAILVQFNPLFEIMPGTAPAKRAALPDPIAFRQPEPASSAGD